MASFAGYAVYRRCLPKSDSHPVVSGSISDCPALRLLSSSIEVGSSAISSPHSSLSCRTSPDKPCSRQVPTGSQAFSSPPLEYDGPPRPQSCFLAAGTALRRVTLSPHSYKYLLVPCRISTCSTSLHQAVFVVKLAVSLSSITSLSWPAPKKAKKLPRWKPLRLLKATSMSILIQWCNAASCASWIGISYLWLWHCVSSIPHQLAS